jgi:CubicO group peptidase (beta-lactamase class C family)
MSLDVTHKPRPTPPPLDLGRAREVAVRAVESGALPCAVFGVVDAHGIRGLASIDGPDVAVDEDTIFFLASLTKPIVATAVMQYVDEGRLDLQAPLARYLPEFSGSERERVTAWHILTHSSGLPDMPVEVLFHDRPSYAKALAAAMSSTPGFSPGSRFEYASSPWLLLAATMARLSNVSFVQALSLRLTGPLGMIDTTFDPRYDRGRAVPLRGLEINNWIIETIMLRFLARATLPGGGMFGTLRDLLRLGRALLPPAVDLVDPAPRILSHEAVREMGRVHTAGLLETLEDGSTQEVRFGLGWGKPSSRMPGTSAAFTHGGATGGRLWIDPDAGLAFAFLTNLWGAPDEPAYEVLEEVYRAWGT